MTLEAVRCTGLNPRREDGRCGNSVSNWQHDTNRTLPDYLVANGWAKTAQGWRCPKHKEG